MGVKTSSARLLANLRRKGLDLETVCMLGRQELCMTQKQINAMCKDYSDVLAKFSKSVYCEGFINALGAKKIVALDASDFEGAELIWDLNNKIPEEYREKFTCIIDGGTTEHVFSFDRAAENIIDMLSIGGHYIGFIPSNNWNGHGLYQLSPMLYIQLFCEKNGMMLEHIYLCNAFKSKRLKELTVLDSSIRTELNGIAPMELYIVAKKIGHRTGKVVLQQGDYEQKWKGNSNESKCILKLKKILPWEWQCIVKHFGLMVRSRRLLKRVKI